MLMHKNHEDVIKLLPTDHHNGVPQLHVCPTKHIASPGEWHGRGRGRNRLQKGLAVKSNPASVKYMKNKIRLVQEWSI